MKSKDLTVFSSSAVDMNLVEEAVSFINEKLNQGAYKIYEEIGSYLLEKFFGGNIELASSRNPQKAKSYRALCRHEGLAINPARLSIMVRVAAQEQFFSKHKQTTENLSYTQKAELIKLPDDDEKLKLVEKFRKEGTSTKMTAELIAEKRKVVRRPRQPNPPNQEAIQISHESLQPPGRASGLKGLLSLPVASIGILDEDIRKVIANKTKFAEEWERLDDDQKNQLIDQAAKSLDIHVRVLDAYETMDALIRELQYYE